MHGSWVQFSFPTEIILGVIDHPYTESKVLSVAKETKAKGGNSKGEG
jgi:hypothetical protein